MVRIFDFQSSKEVTLVNRGLKTVIVLACIVVLLTGTVAQAAVYDFQGQTVTIAQPWTVRDFSEGENLAHLRKVEQDFNVKIEFKTIAASEMEYAAPATILAGDPIGDVLYLAFLWHRQYLGQGLLYPLNNYADDEYWERVPEVAWALRDAATYDGLIYGFSTNSIGAPWGIFWNKTFFEENGLPNIYELMERGEWTWDKFREICVQARKDLDGDGLWDQYGFASHSAQHMLFTFFAANNASWTKTVDGREVCAFNDPEAVEALEFLVGLQSEELMDTPTWADMQTNFYDGKYGMIIWDLPKLGGIPKDLPYEFGIAPIPLGPRGTEYVFVERGDARTFCIPINTKHDPGALIELVSALYELTDPYIDTEDFWDESVNNYAMGSFDEESVEIYAQLPEMLRIIQFLPKHSSLDPIRAALAGTQSISAALDAFVPVVQAELDDFFESLYSYTATHKQLLAEGEL